MPHPYQCLLYCSQHGQGEAGILVGASGPFLHTFNVRDGTFLSTWPVNNDIESFDKGGAVANRESEAPTAPVSAQGSAERPQKRRRLSPSRDDSGSSAEIVVDDGQEVVLDIQVKQISIPPFIKLAGTSTGQYVVAVTGEDKCIRVFTLSGNGVLTQLSERLMPKRPCALVLTTDDATILCADKFGDVYSLPLLGHTNEPAATRSDDKAASTNRSNGCGTSKFVSAATSLTVHTKGNREALRQQQKITNARVERRALNFDHQLLLGHVSLLTDVICVSITTPVGKSRDYILTSDRDEHVRVSRGIPQAHIVEGYCLGHTNFVSKLCAPLAYPHLLISGGGDDYLLLWDWLAGTIQQKVDLRTIVDSFKKSFRQKAANQSVDIGTAEDDAEGKIAVLNIVSQTRVANACDKHHTEIIVTCEGVPALFIFSLSSDAIITPQSSITLEGNVLDLVCLKEQDFVFYSVDTTHQPLSSNIDVNDQDEIVPRAIGVLRYNSETTSYEKIVTPSPDLALAMESAIRNQSSVSEVPKAKGQSTRDFFYGLESLRKRGSEEQNDID